MTSNPSLTDWIQAIAATAALLIAIYALVISKRGLKASAETRLRVIDLRLDIDGSNTITLIIYNL
ncbi:hypothetical protein [Cohnella rhizosphaerae]|uniref:Uncharacterized protein n=1 Tax=Cohnella rhizosphaerae TaxID=1457232 RepID=A0A9X4KTQ4_9BACL|nr:hypothetical protein [Cohnella rhizosphaerae]MDG0810076.1 hypothetical protein [Cohnella rhizosphaerae]